MYVIVYGEILKWRYPKIIQNKTISISKPKKFRENSMTHDGPWNFGVTHSQSKKKHQAPCKRQCPTRKKIIFQNHVLGRSSYSWVFHYFFLVYCCVSISGCCMVVSKGSFLHFSISRSQYVTLELIAQNNSS